MVPLVVFSIGTTPQAIVERSTKSKMSPNELSGVRFDRRPKCRWGGLVTEGVGRPEVGNFRRFLKAARGRHDLAKDRADMLIAVLTGVEHRDSAKHVLLTCRVEDLRPDAGFHVADLADELGSLTEQVH